MNITRLTILILGIGILIGYFIGFKVKENSFNSYIDSTQFYRTCVNDNNPKVAEYCGNEAYFAYPEAY